MEGYLVLTDLVSAKVYKDRNLRNKTYTTIGTPHYMAPEIIMSKGYSFCSSLYSLGIVLFELMCGYVPFGDKKEDPLEIYEEILDSELNLPKSLKDPGARKLIEQLLNKFEPESRMGGPTIESLKNNAWFEHISWVRCW
jgi:cGMP-dependent protein kinase